MRSRTVFMAASIKPLGECPLADIFPDRLAQCVQLAELAFRQSALVNIPL